MLRTFRRALTALAFAVLTLFILPVMVAQAATQTLPGDPLQVSSSDTGQIQARFINSVFGSTDNFFFPPSGDIGSSGFFLRTEAGTTFSSGYRGTIFTPVSNGPVTGNATPSSPFQAVTVYDAIEAGTPVARVAQVTRYTNTTREFRVTWTVSNMSGAPLRYRAGFTGDLYVDGDDSGSGVFIPGARRFVGGTNNFSRIVGGVEEVLESQLPGEPSPTSIAPWAGYEVGYYSTLFDRSTTAQGFLDSITPDTVDNGLGVEWEDHLAAGQGLAAGAQQRYELRFKVRQPVPLTLTPAAAAKELPAQHQVLATVVDANGAPVPDRVVRWTISGPHATSGSATTGPQGQVTIAINGTTPGRDDVEAYVDVDNDGTRDDGEPAAGARVTWLTDNHIEPPSVTPPARPGGQPLDLNVQTNPDDPDQRFFTLPSSQVSEFEECAGGGRLVNLPITVPIVAGNGTIDPGSVSLVTADPTSDDPDSPSTPSLLPDSVNGASYTFIIECVRRLDLFVRFTLTEGGNSETFLIPIGGLVLIDPQGVVYDRAAYDAAVGSGQSPEQARSTAAITGATVRLQRLAGGEWRNVLSGDPGIAPNVNPQVTGADGRYQWDVAEGSYRVSVVANGFVDVVSRQVDIPPPVLDLHIPMERVGASGGQANPTPPGVAPPLSRLRRKAKLSLVVPKKGLKIKRNKVVLGKIRCPATAASCPRVTARLLSVLTRADRRAKRKPTVLARGSALAKPGRKAKLVVKLTKAGRESKAGRRSVTLEIKGLARTTKRKVLLVR